MKKFHIIFILLMMSVVLQSCTLPKIVTPEPSPAPTLTPTDVTCEEDTCTILTQPMEPHPAAQPLEEVANAVILALQARDLKALESYVHPGLGVRFTPYAYVTEKDLVFKREVVSRLFDDPTVYDWGAYDGSGLPIELTFEQYYDEFIYSADFANAEQVAYNQSIGQGNSINNLTDFYPDAEYVEFHFSGFDPQYEGMDWQSLRLVFVKVDALYYLVGIINAQWTI
ncbi:MAG: hypothetical protein MUO40_10635 [Anaerolineaceae bacterium]|nr:hypothetical protein [Anaerolineaceae bacterium]